MGHHFDRALVLLEQSRHELAASELRLELAQEPNHLRAHALLALCLAKREQFKEATEEARQAIALGPDNPYPHYVMATVLHDRHRLDEAAEAIQEAIRLEPEDADYWSLLAGIRFEQRRWPAALEAAEQGLQLEAEHVGCNNLRAMALVKLGRKAEAGATIDAALARTPENAVTHANMGWTLLEKGDSQKALEHFREALRINPELEWARAGIVEALKARNIIYALMLRYFLWMAKLQGRTQILIIIGAYIGFRYAMNRIEQRPELGPWLWPPIVAYIAFAAMTWIADPLFNLMLRFSRFGRMALSREQTVASNWLGGYLALLALLGVLALATGHTFAKLAALSLLLIGLPFAATIRCRPGWPRRVLIALTTGLTLLALSAFAIWGAVRLRPEWDGPGPLAAFGMLLDLFLWGAILAPWAAIVLAGIRPKR